VKAVTRRRDAGAPAFNSAVPSALANKAFVVHGFSMSTVELIAEKSRALPADLQQEALHYVDYLLARQKESGESVEWSKFSSIQLAAQYAPGDAVYDED
jgi:hypothetical protein